MELSQVTKLPPQRLMLIVAGGIAAGLLWRKFSGKSSGSAGSSVLPEDALDGSLSYPDDLNSYPMDTSGNRRDLYGSTVPTPTSLDQLTSEGAVGYETDDPPNTWWEPERTITEQYQGGYNDQVQKVTFDPTDRSHWEALTAEEWDYISGRGYTPPQGAVKQA